VDPSWGSHVAVQVLLLSVQAVRGHKKSRKYDWAAMVPLEVEESLN